MKWLAALILLITIVSACAPKAPSDSVVQTAIAQTQSSNPTATPTEKPTNTVMPTNTQEPTNTSTPEPSATFTPEPTPSPTPDIRIIVGRPEDYVLQPDDLPNKFILRAGKSTPHENYEILSVRGKENGKAYLEASGRIGGWIIWYDCVESTAIAPDRIRSYIVMYDLIDGPVIANSDEWKWGYDDYETVEMDMDLGDWN